MKAANQAGYCRYFALAVEISFYDSNGDPDITAQTTTAEGAVTAADGISTAATATKKATERSDSDGERTSPGSRNINRRINGGRWRIRGRNGNDERTVHLQRK